MEPKMTGWFGGNVAPVRKGWYQVKAAKGMWFADNYTGATTKHTKRYWNGLRWKWRNQRGRMVNAGVSYEDSWRGFTEEQK